MRSPRTLFHGLLVSGLWAFAGSLCADPAPATTAPSEPVPATKSPAQVDNWKDAHGNFYRKARTGHVTNYDEAKVGGYTLPDPLVFNSGLKVSDRDTWQQKRRPEILELYRNEIYGRVPPHSPRVSFEVIETDPHAINGLAVRKVVAAHFGDAAGGLVVHLHLYLPEQASGRVPVLLHMLFGAPPLLKGDEGLAVGVTGKPREAGPITDFLSQGYGYAIFRYTEIEPDGAAAQTIGIRSLARADGQNPPAKDEWGSISAWAWGASRMLDYLEKDPGVDANRVALIGHSRLGKTVLWAGAQDERFALIFSSCSGEMGASLARRDYGETVDDMAASFGYQFAGNFQRYIGHWNDLPVDTHCLIGLSAPRPVLITGGTQDQWADPRGEFLAEVAAGPIYRLLGKKDLGAAEFPAPDSPLITGDLGFHYHTGPHAITAVDWKIFLEFAARYLQVSPAVAQK